ncbi:MAG: YihY/virulence factor BrkB family protein [Gemmatimonadales bacterium]
MRRTLQAADENNIPFLASAITFDALLAAVPFIVILLVALTYLAEIQGTSSQIDIHQLLQPFLPPHVMVGGRDPFTVVESILAGIARNRDKLTLYAIPSFIWFSTRLFAGIRTALNHLYDVSLRPTRRHFIVAYLLAKLRDVIMVVAVVALFLLNTVMGTGLSILRARGAANSDFAEFLLSTVGRILGDLLTLGFTMLLFFVVYRFASIRRLPWRSAVVAAAFTTLAFELAKRLFSLYISGLIGTSRLSFDANIFAVILFVLWVWYTALVFLLGGVVAETWDLRARVKEQRAVLM